MPTIAIPVAITHVSGHVQIMRYVLAETAPDGSVRRQYPSDGASIAALAQQVAALHADTYGDYVSHRLVTNLDDLPTERLGGPNGATRVYRNALRDSGTALAHDITVAKGLAVADAQARAVIAERQTPRPAATALADAVKSVQTLDEIDAIVKG